MVRNFTLTRKLVWCADAQTKKEHGEHPGGGKAGRR